jgi:hypothetical protein
MTFQPYIPEGLIPIPVGGPSLGNTAITEWINVSEAQMVWIYCYATVAGATVTQCTPAKAYTAAGVGTAVLGFNVPIWYGHAAAGVAVTLGREADAAFFDMHATAGVHQCVFELNPANLGWEATVPSLGEYKYVSITMAGEAADYISCTFFVLPRYKSPTISTARWIV